MKGEVQYLPLYINSQVVSTGPNFSKDMGRATPENAEEKRCKALLLTVQFGLECNIETFTTFLKPNLNQKQNADDRKVFALFNTLKAEKEGRKVIKSGVSRGYWLTRRQGRSWLQEVSSKH